VKQVRDGLPQPAAGAMLEPNNFKKAETEVAVGSGGNDGQVQQTADPDEHLRIKSAD